MTTFLLILLAIAGATAAVFYLQKQKVEKTLASERERAAAEINRLSAEAVAASANAQSIIVRKTAELDAEARRVREHYETESRKIIEDIPQ